MMGAAGGGMGATAGGASAQMSPTLGTGQFAPPTMAPGLMPTSDVSRRPAAAGKATPQGAASSQMDKASPTGYGDLSAAPGAVASQMQLAPPPAAPTSKLVAPYTAPALSVTGRGGIGNMVRSAQATRDPLHHGVGKPSFTNPFENPLSPMNARGRAAGSTFGGSELLRQIM